VKANSVPMMTLQQLQEVLGAELIAPAETAVVFSSISTDSRTLQRGALFVALQGPRFDGHDYLSRALESGAVAAIVSQPQTDIAFPQICVADTLVALGQLAAHWRRQFGIPVVAITGSNGKTTVKEMLAAILRQQHAVLGTKGNLNNEIGVPLTLLGLTAEHQYAVVELGASKAGDIDYLTHMVEPDVALITNVAPAHLEGFGDIAGVARAKGEIFRGLSARGVAVLNADEARVGIWQVMAADKEKICFGLRNNAAVTAQINAESGTVDNAFLLKTPAGPITVGLRLVGRHNVMNALAAAAAAQALDIPLDQIKAGLEAMRPVDGRLAAVGGINGIRLINDTYNANPGSIRAALDVLSACRGETVLVLGDMGELGNAAAALHEQVGRQARTCGITRLYAVGEFAGLAAGTFGQGGVQCDDHEALIQTLQHDLMQGTYTIDSPCTVLVKGSRLMRMEQVVAALATDGIAPGVGQDSVKQARLEAGCF